MSGPQRSEFLPSIRLAARSDIGRLRAANEDSFGLFGRAGGARLGVVADGMGGHRGGATASQLAVATIGEVFERRFGQAGVLAGRVLAGRVVGGDMADDDTLGGEALLRRAIEAANRRVFAMARVDPALEGMGTTVVAFLLDAERLRGTVAHVGDSRAYRYRRGRLEALTTDHSVVAEMQRRGLISAEEALCHPRRNEILRAVGVLPEVEIETRPIDVEAGDSFLLCSDGLTGMLGDDEIEAVLRASEGPQDAVETLIRLANELGGPDNITVQLLALPAMTDAVAAPGQQQPQEREQQRETAAVPELRAPGALATTGAEVGTAACAAAGATIGGGGDAGAGADVDVGPNASIGASIGEIPRRSELRRKRRLVWVAAVALALAAAGLLLSR